ncbi:MAG: MerR family transcriptional regulator [Pseudobacter sp.]|uniref:MerR family transcriptional regulator n=1 Tax=Pseudobacter sp. TaxID=2045420 RepID=UPI003F82126D
MKYSVKMLAELAGVSVRTLHHYDQLGLLIPSERTDAGYRLYGQGELLRLQQILFYKEMELSLTDIAAILDDPSFDMLAALQQHRAVLEKRRDRTSLLLETINKTIQKLTGGNDMITNEELYAGFPKEYAETWREEAIDRWGKDTVEQSEAALRKLNKEQIEKLKQEGAAITNGLADMMHLPVTDPAVQQLIHQHYHHILKWWGREEGEEALDAYRGLSNLYLMDSRYTLVNGAPDLAFTAFITKAMLLYVDELNKKN